MPAPKFYTRKAARCGKGYKPVPPLTIPYEISPLEACKLIAGLKSRGTGPFTQAITLARVAVRTEARYGQHHALPIPPGEPEAHGPAQ